MNKVKRKLTSLAFGSCLTPAMVAATMIAAVAPAGSVQAKGPTNTLLTSVSLGAFRPLRTAVTPDSKTVYVASYNTSSPFGSQLVAIDTQSNTITATIPLAGQTEAVGVAVAANKGLVFVGDFGTSTISVIDTASNRVTATLATSIAGPQPAGLTVNPAGTELWVADADSLHRGTVTVIDIATLTATNVIETGGVPVQIVFSPDGATAYVLNDGSTGLVDVIDTATRTVTNPTFGFGIIAFPLDGISLTPDAKTLYVANYFQSINNFDTNNGKLDNVINVFSHRVPRSQQVLDVTALTPDGKFLYAAQEFQNVVSWVSTKNGQVLGTIGLPAGGIAFWITMSPDGARLYVSDSKLDMVHVIGITGD